MKENTNDFILTNEDLVEILNGYVEAALFTEKPEVDDDEYEVFEGVYFTFDNVNTDGVLDDIKQFIEIAGNEAVQEAIDKNGQSRFGFDIWLTRNAHGAGFQDYKYKNEKLLIKAADQLGEKDIDVDFEGRLFFC